MAFPTYWLTTIEEAVRVGTTLTQSWFRGHSKVVGALTPRIFRAPYTHSVFAQARTDFELDLIHEFRRQAPPQFHHPLPSDDDKLGWLILMQHYLVPTRLLDWTENVLVALFFAVTADPNEDAELWAIYPQVLNQESVGYGWPVLSHNKQLRFLIEEPHWRGEANTLAEHLELNDPVTTPMAFKPNRMFARMVVQESTFTVHPKPRGEQDQQIQDLLTGAKEIVRYIIPKGRKDRLRWDLYNIGITDASLFSDPEALSRTLYEYGRIIAYGPPDPPPCGGPVDDVYPAV